VFGFSRGAFTVRTLVGLITDCGIIDCDRLDRAATRIERWMSPDTRFRWRSWLAWRAHRRHYSAVLKRVALPRRTGAQAAQAFRGKYSVSHTDERIGHRAPVHFVGVWDTVAAVGLPFDEVTRFINRFIIRFSFPDLKLSPLVHKACHAIALDDERRTFHPIIWDETNSEEPLEKTPDRIEQVWFAGVHSNVGGGYPRQGMSLVALHWMMTRAENNSLRFLKGPRAAIREGQNVHAKLYDSRSGAAVYYRYAPRDVNALCRDKEGNRNAAPRIHESTLFRIVRSTEGYAPGDLPADLRISTSGNDWNDEHTNRLGKALATATRQLPPPRRWIRLGQWSHNLLLAASASIVAVGIRLSGAAEAMEPSSLARPVTALLGSVHVPEFFIDRVVVPLLSEPALGGSLVGVLIAAWLFGAWTGGRVHSARRRYWNEVASDYGQKRWA
jgi:hypothetical protein